MSISKASPIDVSFFIPIYRPNKGWLDEAVSSIVALIRKSSLRCELLLGDDGSPEPVELSVYEQSAPEIVRTWRFPVNRGVGAVSSDLAAQSRGRYVASFDQDDIMLPFDLDSEIAFLDSHREYCASYAPKFLFNANGLTGDVHGDLYSPFQAFFSPKININAMLIRREILESHEWFKPVPGSRINHDVWLMLRMAEDGVYYFSRHPRALYRMHDQQTSHADRQCDWLLIGQDIACRHPREYRDLLLSENPDPGKTPKERLLRNKLAGLVLFLNQKNPVIVQKMMDYAIRNFPEDFGVWECQLHLLSSQDKEEMFWDLYGQIEKRFQKDSEAMLIFAREAFFFERRLGRQHPRMLETYRRLESARIAPPPIVQQALRKVQKIEGTAQAHCTYTIVGSSFDNVKN